jgi:hypothetical protein
VKGRLAAAVGRHVHPSGQVHHAFRAPQRFSQRTDVVQSAGKSRDSAAGQPCTRPSHQPTHRDASRGQRRAHMAAQEARGPGDKHRPGERLTYQSFQPWLPKNVRADRRNSR